MPGGDRTGPRGLGPMTGRAAGYCAGYPAPGYMNGIPGRGRGGFGRGGGRGRGWGRGFGMGFGRQGFAYPYEVPYYGNAYPAAPYAPEITPQQEASMLKEQAKAMQEEINSLYTSTVSEESYVMRKVDDHLANLIGEVHGEEIGEIARGGDVRCKRSEGCGWSGNDHL